MDENNNPKTTEEKTKENIIKREIEEEMKQSYVDYAMSVIVGRALPDVKDGLKPVHRRILYAMHEMHLNHNKPFKKSATVVGSVLGKYHPHGDSAVYDALVRMAQDFSLRYPLVRGQGNFGSIDGDSAAAYRYTEAKLNKLSEELLLDIDKDTVDFVPNFDNNLKEPLVLPSKAPNLLINGSSGIAVGMATNIPPHNMGEIIDGTISLIDNPEITIPELMNDIKGPDFPTGALICGKNGIINAYLTGRGKAVIRARTEIEEKNNKKRIIVKEIPYQVNKAELISHIASLVRDKKIEGISDLRDESDRDGMRIVIMLKKDANHEILLNHLYRHSRMQVTFGIGMLALVNNEPKTLNLKELLEHFIDHRKDVVRRRTEFELRKAKDRAHILEGLIIALDNIDKAIKLIKASDSTKKAKESLISEFSLSDKQASAILEMKLQKLTSLEQESLRDENKKLIELIKELTAILSDPQKILNIIKEELLEIKEKYADERKSEIIDLETTELNMEDLVEEGEMVVTITRSGYIKRMPIETYKQQKRGGKGVIGASTNEEDVVKDLFIANTHAHLLFFTNKGKLHWLKVYYIPEASRTSKGKAIVNLIGLEKDEKIAVAIPVKNFDDKRCLVMATKNGLIKKTKLCAYSKPRKGGIIGITLKENDELINVKLTKESDNIMLVTKNGKAIRFDEKDARQAGRSAQGSRGIKLKENDEVVDLIIAKEENKILTITENGYGKRTKVSDYRLISRGGSGVKNIICSERNGKVVSVNNVSEEDDVMFISRNGIIIRVPASGISIIGRNTQGLRLMRLSGDDKVVAATKIVNDENSEEVE